MQVRHPVRALVNLLVRRAPIEAELIVTRRCNLSCGYCTEYDKTSECIPLGTLQRRIDALHRLHAINISLLGGEPLLHPDLPAIVAYANRHAQVSITTNGFLLTRPLIHALNAAGLANLQMSIDAVEPDRTAFIQKNLKTLRPKLALLREHAAFDVTVNLVLCAQTKATFEATLDEMHRLGVRVSVGLEHDGHGAVAIEGPDYARIWERYYEKSAPFSFIERTYGASLLAGRRPAWHCRAGSRSIYVDEFGDVQLCSAQRGRLAKPLEEYRSEDLRTEHARHKGCEAGCSLLCHYRSSAVDNRPLASLVSAVKVLARRKPRADAGRRPAIARAPMPELM